MTFRKKQYYTDSKNDLGLSWLDEKERENNRQNTEEIGQ
jgi:hypothetical protein